MEKKKPEIRFNGFEGEWVKDNAVYIFETYYDKNHPNLPVLSASQELGMVIRDNVGFQVQHNKENEVGYKRVLPGQFVIHLRSFQGGFAHSMVEGITSPAYTVMQFKNSSTQDDIYWKYVLTSKTFIKRLETVTYGIRDGRSISFEDFSELNFTFPSLSEQEKIGLFLTTLDKLIAKLEAKLDKLRKLKQALLEKMFVNVNRGGYETPEIRFKGYTDKWQVKELREVAMRVVSKNEDNRVTLPLTISAQYGLISQTDFFNNRIAAKDVRKYYVIKKGEFAYNRSTSEGSPFGAVKRLDRYNAGVLSTLYLVFRISSEEIDSNYLVCYFSTDSWHKHIEENAAEGARNHGLLNITSEDFFTTPIKVPMKKEEQSKVALSIRTLENILSKTSTKLTKLRNIKQSLLQKMFA